MDSSFTLEQSYQPTSEMNHSWPPCTVEGYHICTTIMELPCTPWISHPNTMVSCPHLLIDALNVWMQLSRVQEAECDWSFIGKLSTRERVDASLCFNFYFQSLQSIKHIKYFKSNAPETTIKRWFIMLHTVIQLNATCIQAVRESHIRGQNNPFI